MAITTTQLAEYLRLPPDSAEELNLYLSAARSKARTAGIPDFEENAQYDMMLLTLAAMYYENRGTAPDDSMRDILNSFVLELRYADEDGDGS